VRNICLSDFSRPWPAQFWGYDALRAAVHPELWVPARQWVLPVTLLSSSVSLPGAALRKALNAAVVLQMVEVGAPALTGAPDVNRTADTASLADDVVDKQGAGLMFV